MVALAVGALVLASIDAVRFVGFLIAYARSQTNEARVATITTVVKALDGYLIAALLIVVAYGLYELFVKPIDPAEGSTAGRRLREVHDLEDLKQRVGKLVVLILIGEFLQEALALPVSDHQDLLALGAGTVLVAGALYLTGRSSSSPCSTTTQSSSSRYASIQLMLAERMRLYGDSSCRHVCVVRGFLMKSFFASSAHSTMLARPTQVSQSPIGNGVVSNTWFMKGSWTTAICRRVDNAMAPQRSRLVKTLCNALTRSERALKALNSWAKTRVVKAIVRA